MKSSEIKKFREKHRLSQEQLAKIVNMKISTVQSWEQGKRNIGQSAIKLLQGYEKELENQESERYSMEDLLAKEMIRRLEPLLEEFRTSHKDSWDQMNDLVKLAASIVQVMSEMKGELEKVQGELRDIKSQTTEMHDVVAPSK